MSEPILEQVQAKYAAAAASSLSGTHAGVRAVAEAFGYSPEELAAIPAEANLGLSCGNPTAFASLRPGETVVDLGCGGGRHVLHVKRGRDVRRRKRRRVLRVDGQHYVPRDATGVDRAALALDDEHGRHVHDRDQQDEHALGGLGDTDERNDGGEHPSTRGRRPAARAGRGRGDEGDVHGRAAQVRKPAQTSRRSGR